MELRQKLIGCGLCEDNEFLDKYVEIVTSHKDNQLTEEHHIIPRFWYAFHNIPIINGDNLVKLSYKQHFLAHYYLMKCVDQSCEAFAKAAVHAVRCMLPKEQMGGFRGKCLETDSLTDDELKTLASIVDECRFKYCALSKWNWFIDYFNEHAVPLVNRLAFKVTDEILELSSLTYKQLYSLAARLHHDGLIDKQPFLYLDDDNSRLENMKLVEYIEEHAVDGKFECSEEFLLQHRKSSRQIMKYMDTYGTKGISIDFHCLTSYTVPNSLKVKWASYLKENMNEDGTFGYTQKSLAELNVTYKVLASTARHMERQGIRVNLVNLDIVQMKQAKLDREQPLLDYLRETNLPSYNLNELAAKFGSIKTARIKALLRQENRKLNEGSVTWATIEKWFMEKQKEQCPVLISDSEAYTLMCQINPTAYEGTPYAYSRMRLYGQLYDHGYQSGIDFYMIESKSYKIDKIKEFVKANAVDGVLEFNPQMLTDFDTTKSKLANICKTINIKLFDSSISVPPKNVRVYEYIRKFPVGSKIPYTDELLHELNVAPHKFNKICNRLGYGVSKQYKCPIW